MKADIIARICEALSTDDVAEANHIAQREYPFEPRSKTSRRYTEFQSMQVFLRDGFIDRYSGSRLVFPGTLRVLGDVLPDSFPAHPYWKMSESHLMYWELFPTIDHVVPVARGGLDDESNWVCASMLRNQAKSSWLLAELGWELLPPGDLADWDGLARWFIDYTARKPSILEDAYLKRWNNAARRALKTL